MSLSLATRGRNCNVGTALPTTGILCPLGLGAVATGKELIVGLIHATAPIAGFIRAINPLSGAVFPILPIKGRIKKDP